MLLKGREDAKKQASIFNHKIEGKMIKKVEREVQFTYCVLFFSDPLNHEFFKVHYVFVHGICFFQPSGLKSHLL